MPKTSFRKNSDSPKENSIATLVESIPFDSRHEINTGVEAYSVYENKGSKYAAVTSHLNFCMMATMLTWIYADRLKTDPERRRHKVKGRASFAFSDIRRIIAEAALDPDFERVCPKYSSSPVNSVVAVLLRMVA
ncbi:hypothetical protein [Bathymodiolus japonicus methanotrophic gill symbiont]|uniref:hypothetical protein n=1 Tax=Bathymodiolus japonicus methanotrophic gill symbiont TaxID=113269 RepID=UPI001E53E9AB|nr:hypothetical protein [Bathymodiolus japonicus methanotrophic gill symbiont]